MTEVYNEEVGAKWPLPLGQPTVHVSEEFVTFGEVKLPRGSHQSQENLLLLRSSFNILHSLATCVHHKWLSILVRFL